MNDQHAAEYAKLSANDRTVVCTLAYGVFPLEAYDLYRWMKEANLKTEEKKAFTVNQVEGALDRAVKAGLVVRTENSIYGIMRDEARWQRSLFVKQTPLTAQKVHNALDLVFPCYKTSYSYGYSELFDERNAFRKLILLAELDYQGSFQEQMEAIVSAIPANGESWGDYWAFLLEELIASQRLGWVKASAWPEISKALGEFAFFSLDYNRQIAQHLLNSSIPYMVDTAVELQSITALVCLERPPVVTDLPLIYQAAWAFLDDEASKAQQLFQTFLESGDTKGAAEPFLDHPLFFLQAPLQLMAKPSLVAKLNTWGTQHPQCYFASRVWRAFFRNRSEPNGLEGFWKEISKDRPRNLGNSLLLMLAQAWLGHKVGVEEDPALINLAETLEGSRLRWYELEAWHLLAKGTSDEAMKRVFQAKRDKIIAETNIHHTLAGFYSPAQDWEVRLERLELLTQGGLKDSSPKEERMIWLLDATSHKVFPQLQKRLKNGQWSTPKDFSWRRIEDHAISCATPADELALKSIKLTSWGDYVIDEPQALRALVGHPNVYLRDDLNQPIDLEGDEIILQVEERNGKTVFSFSSDPLEPNPKLQRTGPHTWRIPTVSSATLKIAEVLGNRLEVPASEQKRIVSLLEKLSGAITIHSPLLQSSQAAHEVPTDSRLVVLVVPRGSGLELSLYVKPLGESSPLVLPGEGPKMLHGREGEKLVWTQRDFSTEKSARESLLQACPQLAAYLGDLSTALVLDPQSCLEVLSELRQIPQLRVEWPKGQTLKVLSSGPGNSTRLRAHSTGEWLQLEGTITIDTGRVLELRELLNCMTNLRGRFVPLGDGEFLELETRFLQELQHVAQLADTHNRIHRLALLSSDLLLAKEGVEVDQKLADFKQKIVSSYTTPSVPQSLLAELRPYQEEGFQWLCRLEAIGAGACLADDMGLGKTLQCLALLLHRHSRGPALVVAPTSVCRNWEQEMVRFAPDLRPQIFGVGDRVELVNRVGPGDVVLVTYGLLVSSSEVILGREWATVILDEAHVIKNLNTQRTRIVQRLKADFRVAVTGTPLQNHLGELWSLFEFLNPGFLGSQTDFQRRFLLPIERDKDERVRRVLKDLIKPFLLRRTKSQVLQDLPTRSEQTVEIELSVAEQTFYEALRQKTMADLEAKKSAPKGEFQIYLLSQLTKLRRACCHPNLAGDRTHLLGESPASKIAYLLELMEQLRENKHRVLIFSQFVDHLTLIQDALTKAGFTFEYLDGSLSARERSVAIQNFQNGSADAFLISLQAGGVGLNLTAADYVVHMDPWWNPAIEDQASDRAHRIGQTRPVTIYRLIAKNTIEEKIVRLHQSKRDLADALLEGSEGTARLGADQLLDLIKEGLSG